MQVKLLGSENIMGAHLSPYGIRPVTQCDGEDGTGTGITYSACTMQGWRKKQEDTYKCLINCYIEDIQYFGVFDGHGGSEVAKYLQFRLHDDIKGFLAENKDPELALQLGFLTCDESLRDPEGVKELNELVEDEDQATVANIEKNRKALLAGISNYGAGCSKDGASSSTDRAGASNEAVGRSNEEVCIGNEEAGTSNDASCNVVDSSSSNHEDSENMSFDDMAASSSTLELSEANEEIEDKTDGVMDTLKYLLKDDLENSDPEDEDFDVEDEASGSESGEDDVPEEYETAFEPGVHSGSTGTVLLINGIRYYCANVGDSRCVLSRGGKAVDMSVDHKPDDPEEEKRIKATGASICDGRINRNLNLSRAFGDFCYKDESLAPFEQCVTVEPSIKAFDIEDNDEFIILASDGIWNSMSSQEVVDFVHMRLGENMDLRTIAEELFRLVLAPDTSGDGTGCDNMTCILIKLKPSWMRHFPIGSQ